MAKFLDIQQDAIKRYGVTLCYGELCKDDWQRTHVHIREKKICKWYPKNSIQSTITLLHEIGHIKTNKGINGQTMAYQKTNKSTYRRCEQEYYATVWAFKEAREHYGLDIPDSVIKEYNDYVKMEHDRGVRRGGNLPPYKTLILK